MHTRSTRQTSQSGFDTASSVRFPEGVSPRTHHSVLRCLCIALTVVFSPSPLWAAHPQDGPHADIRATIDASGVRLSTGLNLGFIDEIITPDRESLQAVADFEAERISRELTRRLLEDVVVTINSQRAQGTIDSHILYTTPEPSLAVIYPRMGMRALMRATTLISYEAPSDQSGDALARVELTWPYHPPDLLAAETEGAVVLPPLVINVLMRAEGEVKLIPTSQAEPTIIWTPGSFDPDAGFVDVPPPPRLAKAADSSSMFWALIAALALAAIGLEFSHRIKRPSLPWLARLVLPVSAAVMITLHITGIWTTSQSRSGRLAMVDALPQAEASRAFAALHANLYHAFDYTSETEVYDALARSVRGPLLPELYDEVYQSLVQADQGGLEGIITAYEPEPPEILSIELGTPEVTSSVDASSNTPNADSRIQERLLVRARQSWTIDGTIYHWGHSHTVQTAYTAEYTMAAFDDGWRLTTHRITNQRVTSQPGIAPPAAWTEGEI